MKQVKNDGRDCSDSEFFRLCPGESPALSKYLAKARESLVHEFARIETDQRLLVLALNEAEALAWNTEYPHLFFPVLGEEKARASVAWNQRQRLIKREFAFAE